MYPRRYLNCQLWSGALDVEISERFNIRNECARCLFCLLCKIYTYTQKLLIITVVLKLDGYTIWNVHFQRTDSLQMYTVYPSQE